MSTVVQFGVRGAGKIPAALDKNTEATGKFNKKLKETRKNWKTSAAEAKKYDRLAQQITRQNEGAQERYNRKLRDAKKALAGKARETELLAKETTRLRVAMLREIDGQNKIKAKRTEVTKKHKRELRGLRTAQKQTFGKKGLEQLDTYATSLGSVAGAIGLITLAFADAEAAAQSAADTAFASIGEQGELQQLSPERLATINQGAKDLIGRGVFTPDQRAQAFKASFSLESAGFTDQEREFVTKVGEQQFVKSSSFVEFGGKIKKTQELFGEALIGSLEDTLDKIVVAAASTQSDVNTIAGSIPTFAGEARNLGLDPEEVLATFVGIEKESKNPEIASVRMRAVLKRIAKDDLLVDGDLTKTFEAIQDRVKGGEKISDIFSDVRGAAGALGIINRLPFIENLEQGINDSPGAFKRQGGGLAKIDPVFSAGLVKRRAEGSLAVTEESLFAEKETLFDALAAERREIRLSRGDNPVLTSLIGFGESLDDAAGLEETVFRKIVKASDFNQLSPGLQEGIKDFITRQDAKDQTAALKENTTALNNLAEKPAFVGVAQ